MAPGWASTVTLPPPAPAQLREAPIHYPGSVVVLVGLDDLQVQNELGKYQKGIQDHEADDDDLWAEGGSKREP